MNNAYGIILNMSQKDSQKNGGYHTVELILVQAVAWAVLLPMFLYYPPLFAGALFFYLVALSVIAGGESYKDHMTKEQVASWSKLEKVGEELRKQETTSAESLDLGEEYVRLLKEYNKLPSSYDEYREIPKRLKNLTKQDLNPFSKLYN